MTLWKFGSYLKNKREFTKKKKNSKMPHNTNSDRRQAAPEQKAVTGKLNRKSSNNALAQEQHQIRNLALT